MAERATADRVQSDMRPPNFRGAIKRLRTIQAKKERMSAIAGEISGVFDTVEGYKINKKAARIFLTLDRLEPDEQQDIWRSLMGLIEHAEWQGGDLVDLAEGGQGNIVVPFGRKGKAEGSDDPDGEKDLAETIEAIGAANDAETSQAPGEPEEAPEPAAPAAKGQRISPAEARARAKRHFGQGEAPPPSTQPDPEPPFTGDNSDLAGE